MPEQNNNQQALRVVVDTNLWISFLIGKRLSVLLEMFEDPWFELVCTPLLRDEIVAVANRPKFRRWFTAEKVSQLQQFIDEEMTMVDIDEKSIPLRCRDPKDDYLLELAVQSQAIYLVSGDEDLLALGQIEGCRIMTIRQFEDEWHQSRDF